MKTIKVMEMLRKIRDTEYAKTKNKTPAELISYIRTQASTANAAAHKMSSKRLKTA